MNDRNLQPLQYTLKEAAQILGVSEKTLRREYVEGRILFRTLREGGGKYFIDHEECVRWRNSLPQPAPGERAAS
ncbi:helix-turn-helix domain-containing protein [Gordonia westfalica]|uniref:Helix-turn-helix domain-containing protein n=1 Tax=Gordonia westfalica TaxID=158898 RepID=A0A1H2DT38_9ACTN|nr:helix-turn-helix domain-containing protein [Gordonia westfalica]SDT83719.1 Helix-turn-helix domain-containing protein [Gordonia westfalica]SDT83928.1 Helix-turn-helix domain-containing protein [Gordonia westfalica]SDT83974.1 Helix-turn-helix domain-containing protein [Gordonia westfalica]SDT85259.1 Helix-turn-helix domain-containing protein [Gordonia westfalica]SDT85588.1 Helix-turn-helix domain-containing protein [Gordonia westfalica]